MGISRSATFETEPMVEASSLKAYVGLAGLGAAWIGRRRRSARMCGSWGSRLGGRSWVRAR
ncbi:hypothetical protein BN381_10005 [Candidatus Microthrix parvicella RN1]|uniref:Uncharacterized protein n=1 Tax=Candidatus Neomicrothrix parvicella RN1 TaxID=1229780 RepID=R4YVF3_9ACTN|nr:hypothetical protein BN381_10005 [Candidatus Microthrix parvicella RN1]